MTIVQTSPVACVDFECAAPDYLAAQTIERLAKATDEFARSYRRQTQKLSVIFAGFCYDESQPRGPSGYEQS
jgi:hypothetical protein